MGEDLRGRTPRNPDESVWDRMRAGLDRPGACADEEFDTWEALGSADAAHYERFLGPGSVAYTEHEPPAQPGWTWKAEVSPARAPDRSLAAIARQAQPPEADGLPQRWGGPAGWCSSDTRLELSPAWCWDVCLYYRRLGVHWRATRRQLRRAYAAMNGPSRRDLPYVMTQLLDPGIRREYDMLELGTVWIRDRVVAEVLKRRAISEAASRAPGNGASPENVLREWGYGLSRGSVPPAGPDHGPSLLDEAGDREGAWYRAWSYYVLGDTLGSWKHEGRMQEWQEALLAAFAALGSTVRFAVGCADDTPQGFVIRASDLSGSLIIFLAGDKPLHELAFSAAAAAGAFSRTAR